MSKLEKQFPIYSKFLKLYPEPYRKDYGDQMMQTLSDMLDNERRSPAVVWSKLALDLPFSLAKQNLIYTGVVMTKQTPRYVKYASLIGAVMLVPFFAALIANGLDKVINNHTLNNSWIWSAPVLFVWVIALPIASSLVALSSLLIYLLQRNKNQEVSRIKGGLDLRRDWSLIVVALIGLAIIAMVRFHDSVNCVTGNPIRELKQSSQTLKCIQQQPTRKTIVQQ